jgi:hypothetical protein
MKASLTKRLLYCFVLLLPAYFVMHGQNRIAHAFPKESNEEKNRLFEIPPGTVRINDTLFCDETEVANVHYREYMYWISWACGSESKEFQEAIPDSTVWLMNYDTTFFKFADSCMYAYAQYYFRHPAYDFYPVVGITQKQATAFAKWRSDRVLERVLIDAHKIIEDRAPTKETYFTIERYFRGNLKTILPGEKMTYYPDYTLPTISERTYILAQVDSINKIYGTRYNIHHKKHPRNYMQCRSDILPCIDLHSEPTISTTEDSLKVGYPIYNLRGNVAEWTAEKNVCAGGGWMDNRAKILHSDTAQLSTANAWTGFRNVCVWRKWKK